MRWTVECSGGGGFAASGGHWGDLWVGQYTGCMSALDRLTWSRSKDQPIPEGSPGDRLWVKLGWASFQWAWHPEHGVWAADGWQPGRDMESVAPGASRGDMSWAHPE